MNHPNVKTHSKREHDASDSVSTPIVRIQAVEEPNTPVALIASSAAGA